MNPMDYLVIKIEGEYATLRNVEDGCEIFIALALLPAGTDLETRLHYENFEYEIIE